jgi:hypothetical protein
MNQRIQELALESGAWHQVYGNRMFMIDEHFDIEKFARLIVQECAGLCDKAAEENARTFYTVTETQEVGPALVSKGSQVQAEKLSRQIKQHFGVEE